VVIVGKRGSGKSTHAKAMAAALVAEGARVVAFDVHDEYSKHGRASAAVTLGPLTQRCTVAELVDEPTRLDHGALALAVVPEEKTAEALAQSVVDVIDLCEATGELVLMLDEVGFYAHGHALDRLNVLATQSRHAAMPVVFVAQRTVQVPKTARTQASRIITFLQTNRDDLKELEELTEEPSFASRVKRLARGRFLEWRDPGVTQ
jgi:energy-coupling factor transporter ATP-binding protein EcfA2